MTYFLYILKCADGSLYTGITTNLARRLQEHKNKKGGHYTSAHGALDFIYTEDCKDRSTASKREVEIKRMKRNEKLALVSP